MNKNIHTQVEANYDVPFNNDQWRLEHAKVDASEKDPLPPLDIEARVQPH